MDANGAGPKLPYLTLSPMQENYRLGGAYKWPSLKDVLEYRKQVYDLVCKLIETAPLELPITMENLWVRLYLCILHTVVYLLYLLNSGLFSWQLNTKGHSDK